MSNKKQKQTKIKATPNQVEEVSTQDTQDTQVATKKPLSLKEFIAIIVASVILLSALTVGIVFAVRGSKKASDGLLYRVVDGGYAVVGIGKCEDEDLVIPTYFKGEYVVAIDDSAFYGCTTIKTVSFARNSKVKSIGEYAFAHCSSLTSVTIDKSVESVGERAFLNCKALKSITFEDSEGWGYYFPANNYQETTADFFENDALVEWLTKTELSNDEECGLKLYK